jgi:hypothetical protein
MNRPKNQVLAGALDRYFASFDCTRELASKLILKRKHPVEILILLCARLDALASDAAKDETSSKNAFTRFVTAYGGQRDLLNSISIGDLYYELMYHRWLLEGMIPAPGRLHIFSRLDEPIIHLLEHAGLPLTLKDSEILLDTLIRISKQEYRAFPGQHLTKPRIVKLEVLKSVLVKRALRTRLKKIANNLPDALTPLWRARKSAQFFISDFGPMRSTEQRSFLIHGDSSARQIFTGSPCNQTITVHLSLLNSLLGSSSRSLSAA